MGGVSFEIPGVPVAKGRARISTRGGKVRSFTPAKTASFENRVALVARDTMDGRDPIDGPVALAIDVHLPIAQSWSGKKKKAAENGQIFPCSRPDIDNYVKSICDGCNEIVWHDDCQVVCLAATKTYSGNVGVSVTITPIALGEAA